MRSFLQSKPDMFLYFSKCDCKCLTGSFGPALISAPHMLNHTQYLGTVRVFEGMEEVEIPLSSRTSCKGSVMCRCDRCGDWWGYRIYRIFTWSPCLEKPQCVFGRFIILADDEGMEKLLLHHSRTFSVQSHGLRVSPVVVVSSSP